MNLKEELQLHDERISCTGMDGLRSFAFLGSCNEDTITFSAFQVNNWYLCEWKVYYGCYENTDEDRLSLKRGCKTLVAGNLVIIN